MSTAVNEQMYMKILSDHKQDTRSHVSYKDVSTKQQGHRKDSRARGPTGAKGHLLP